MCVLSLINLRVVSRAFRPSDSIRTDPFGSSLLFHIQRFPKLLDRRVDGGKQLQLFASLLLPMVSESAPVGAVAVAPSACDRLAAAAAATVVRMAHQNLSSGFWATIFRRVKVWPVGVSVIVQ